MTTQEKIAVMQAWVDGKIVEWKPKNSEDWRLIVAEPSWNYPYVEYRIKPEASKRVFGPKDFPPGTVMKEQGWTDGEYRSIVAITEESLEMSAKASGIIHISFHEINSGKLSHWSFSTDKGKTWTQLKP